MNAPVNRAMETGAGVTLSVRETRMIVERILLAAGLPGGLVPAVGNCILYSQATGLGGLAAFEGAIPSLEGARLNTITLVDGPDGASIDGGGNHAWLVANDALDMAIAMHRRGVSSAIKIGEVSAPDELRVIEGLAQRHRAAATVTVVAGKTTVQITADRLPGADPIMAASLRDGFRVPRGLWRSLYDRSGAALTPDSIESRRHAGPVMVDAEGRVHGRDDDDTDFELLLGQKTG